MTPLRRVLLYSALAAILIFKSWLWGEVYVPAGMLDWFYPWRHYAVQEDARRPLAFEGFAQRDDLLMLTPEDTYVHAALREGRLPLWNPDVLCGTPFAAYYRTIWYPPRALLLWAFDPLTASLLSVFLHLVVAGLAMSAFLRSLKMRDGPADFGGIVWMLTGYSTAWLEIAYVPIATALLPLLMLGATRLAARRDAGSFAMASAAMGMLFVGCHWQFAMYGAAFGALWLTACLWRGEGRGRLLWVPAMCLTGVLVGAVQILPTLQLASLSDRPPMPALEAVNEQCRLLPEMLATLVVPELFGSQAAGFFWSRINSPLQTFSELIVYVGIIPLLMIFGAPRCGIPAWRFFGVGAVVALLLASGSPLFSLAWAVLPVVRFLTPVRILWIVAFCMAVLAACGAQRFSDHGRLAGGWRGAAALLLAVVVAESAAFSLFVPGAPWFDDMIGAYIRRGSFPLPNYGDANAYVAGLVVSLQRHYDLTSLPFLGPLMLAAAALGVAVALQRKFLGREAAALLLVLLTIVDLLGFGIRANPTAPRSALYPQTVATRLLASLPEGFRIGGVGRMPHPELFLAYGLEDIGGYQSLCPGTIRRLYARLNGEEGNYMMATLYGARYFNHGIADLLGVRYLYSDSAEAMPKWATRVPLPDLVVHQNGEALPRLFFVPECEVLGSEDAVLARMTQPAFDPRRGVLFGASPRSLPAGPPAATRLLLEMTRPRPEVVELRATLPRAGWVVFTETAYPGWRARLDDVDVPVETAYAAFMAVAVPSGEHRLQLVYDPPVQRWGMIVSASTWLVLLLGTVVGRLREGKVPPPIKYICTDISYPGGA